MADDTCCTLVPYFLVADGKLADFQALIPRFLERTRVNGHEVLPVGGQETCPVAVTGSAR